MTLALRSAVRSDVGLLREGNEDSAYAGPHLLAVADGMGGHAAGEVASAATITTIAPLDEEDPGPDLVGALADAVATANLRLQELIISDPAIEGMGTTLTALLWAGSQVAMCHIGDSRAYLLRDGDFYQISRDHTLVQTLVDEGRLTAAAAATHPQRSLVMRALQSSTDAEPDLNMREAMHGDRYLLCSDGLSDVVADQTIHKTLVSCPDPAQAVEELINLALRGGGPDNITCIVADVVDTVSGPVPPSRAAVLAGAAANGDGRPLPRGDSPASRAALLTQARPVPQQAAPPRQPQDGRHRAAEPGYDGDEGSAEPGRRRWPVVTTILAILILLVAGGGYTAWRITQGQYYVGTDGTQVIIYRGINQKVAGLNLSSTYQRTGIPVSHVQGSVLELPTASGSLPEAQRTVANIRQAYTCDQATKAVQNWLANKPKPPVIAKGKKPTRQQRQQEAKVKAYPPKPKVPASCPAQGAG
ncbi:MAG TPA: PP2C family serine/threonine-protein phosphatase [Streptosporangiaceae bacterium]|nr:PP2C family serine/threonine-protein phosphatase [Streptosporangiaceae bacterium]